MGHHRKSPGSSQDSVKMQLTRSDEDGKCRDDCPAQGCRECLETKSTGQEKLKVE